MKLTLKNLHHSESLSEETPAFTCDLYDNGTLVAHLKNDGRGGPNYVHAPKGKSNEGLYEKYGNLDVEIQIFTLVEVMSFVKKRQARQVIMEKDGELYTKRLKHSIRDFVKHAPDKLKKYCVGSVNEGFKILNTNFNYEKL